MFVYFSDTVEILSGSESPFIKSYRAQMPLQATKVRLNCCCCCCFYLTFLLIIPFVDKIWTLHRLYFHFVFFVNFSVVDKMKKLNEIRNVFYLRVITRGLSFSLQFICSWQLAVWDKWIQKINNHIKFDDSPVVHQISCTFIQFYFCRFTHSMRYSSCLLFIIFSSLIFFFWYWN